MSTSEWDSTDRAEAEAIDGIDAQRERWANRTEAQRAEDEAFIAALRARLPRLDIDPPF